jgi:hypothetical protein
MTTSAPFATASALDIFTGSGGSSGEAPSEKDTNAPRFVRASAMVSILRYLKVVSPSVAAAAARAAA